LIDATHPFAATISANAVQAAESAGVNLLALRRPPWEKVAGDNWIEAESVEQAVEAIGQTAKRVFLALGRNELQPFAAAPQHFYLVRSVDPVDPPLAVPDATYIAARGPFSEEEDRDLLARHKIETIVAKNSGGAATYSKIAAARALGLPVVMLKRPALPDAASVATAQDVVAWLDHTLTLSTARGV
jgi:precorrin-6A/cobalt-precorrin-6A reductase